MGLILCQGTYKKQPVALTGVAQWIDSQPMNQRVTGSIPSQGTWPRLWARSPVGDA